MAASGGRGAAAGGCTARSWGDLPMVPPRPPPPSPHPPAAAAATASPLARREAREACAARSGAGRARQRRGAEPACGAAMSQGSTSGQGRLGDTPPARPPAPCRRGRAAATEGGGGAELRGSAPGWEGGSGGVGGWVSAGRGGSRPSPRPRASFVRGAGVGHGGEGVRGAGPTVSNDCRRARRGNPLAAPRLPGPAEEKGLRFYPRRGGRLFFFSFLPCWPPLSVLWKAARRGCGLRSGLLAGEGDAGLESGWGGEAASGPRPRRQRGQAAASSKFLQRPWPRRGSPGAGGGGVA